MSGLARRLAARAESVLFRPAVTAAFSAVWRCRGARSTYFRLFVRRAT